MKYQLTPIKVARFSKSNNNKYWKCGETLEHSRTAAGGNVKWYGCFGKYFLAIPQKAKHRSPMQPINFIPSYTHERKRKHICMEKPTHKCW